MAGYGLIKKIKYLEERLDSLGMTWGYNRYGTVSDFDDTLVVMPKADALPAFSRDAALFQGTIAGLEIWLQGIEWAYRYDTILGLKTEQRRARAEQVIRNRNLMRVLKSEQPEPGVDK